MGRTGSVVDVVHTPPDDTFTFLTDVHRFCDWNAIMTRLVERSDTLAPGAEWVVEFKALGNTWRSRSTVEECDPNRRIFVCRSRTDDGNPSYAIWRWRVEPAAESGSRVTVSWDLNPKTFWRRVLLARIRARQLQREVPTSIDALARALQGAIR
jgi:Polyketide cyclase / dehydrase and lipid transport